MKGYGNAYTKIIIFSKKNEFSDPIIKIINIPNITFYPFFVYNILEIISEGLLVGYKTF